MKWPRNNSSSSLITRVFPVSWFAKFKQKRGNQEQTSAKNSVLDVPSPIPSSYREGRFYSLDEDDAFWRISFSDDRIQPRRSTGGINPLRHDYDARDLQNPVFSDFKRFGLAEGDEDSGKGDCRNFSEMVSDIKKMRESRGKQRVINNVAAVRHEENAGAEREVFPVHESDSVVSNTRNVTKNPIKEIKTRSKARENNNIMGVKAYSPRTECKIRALEEMKRARARRRGKKKKEKSVFERFAVVKRSVDPEGDFKESMMEMIREKGIGDPDDLEQLLACYLSLNCDQYHNLIIAVFQQVWIELKGTSVTPFILD